MSPLEIAANALATLSILLAGRNSIHTWWTGIIGCLLFAWLFYLSQLYADVTLQLFFIVTSAMGWRQWLTGGAGEPLPISRAGRLRIGLALVIGAAATLGYGALLHCFTDAYAPFADSAVLVLSVTAQLLLMQRRIETWAFWLAVNTIAVPLYASRGLTLTACLYAAYWLNACYSAFVWHRLMRGQERPLAGEAAA